jgi:hypothetical protein
MNVSCIYARMHEPPWLIHRNSLRNCTLFSLACCAFILPDKKLGIPVPGAIKKAPLYKNSYHAISANKGGGKDSATTKKNSSSSSGHHGEATLEGGSNVKRGMKRKSIQ